MKNNKQNPCFFFRTIPNDYFLSRMRFINIEILQKKQNEVENSNFRVQGKFIVNFTAMFSSAIAMIKRVQC